MKIWVKYFIGLILGIAIGTFFTDNPQTALKIVKPVADIFIRIGRYCFFPLLFFSLAVGTHKLLSNKKFITVHIQAFLIIMVTAFVATVIGVLIAIAFSPEKIPVLLEKKTVETIPSITEQLLTIFPLNLFNVFSGSGNFILPLTFLAFLLGANFGFDKNITKPIVQLFDSLNRIFYNINNFILEMMVVGMGFFSAYLFLTTVSVSQLALYSQLFLILFIAAIVTVFLILPGTLYLMGYKNGTYKYLYAITGAAIAGLLSGDNYLANNTLIKHCHENLGVSRETGSVSITLFTLFSRPGTAMVSAICFIVMIRSYSNIEVSFLQILFICLLVFATSFLLYGAPGSGVIVLLTFVCSIYGRGLNDAYLMFRPIFPLLLSFAVFLDVIVAGISIMIISSHERNKESDIAVRNFI